MRTGRFRKDYLIKNVISTVGLSSWFCRTFRKLHGMFSCNNNTNNTLSIENY